MASLLSFFSHAAQKANKPRGIIPANAPVYNPPQNQAPAQQPIIHSQQVINQGRPIQPQIAPPPPRPLVLPGVNTAPNLPPQVQLRIHQIQDQIAHIKSNAPQAPVSPMGALNIARNFVTQPAAEIAASVTNKSVRPTNPVTKALIGNQPVKPIQQDVKGVYQAVKAGHQNLPGGIPISPKLAGPYAVADAVLHGANDLPLAGAAVKGAKLAKDAAIPLDIHNPLPGMNPGAVGKNVSGVGENLPAKIEKPKFASIDEAVKEMQRPKEGKQGVVLSHLEIQQLDSMFAKSTDPINQQFRGKVYGRFNNARDVILGHANGQTVVAELDKNAIPTGRVRVHSTPLQAGQIVGDFGKVNMHSPTAEQLKYKLPPKPTVNPAQPIGVGKNVSKSKLPIKMSPNALENVFKANPLAPKVPNVPLKEPVDNNLLTTMDKVIANSGGTPQEAARMRIQQTRNADAERIALDHLQKGGSKNEAVKLYQQTAHTTQKQASFRVAQAAKQANQALNVSKRTPNPLIGKFTLPEAKLGQYRIAPQNQATVNNNINKATQGVEKAFKPLSQKDQVNIPHYVEGTKDISKAENPQAVTQAVTASKNLTDTIHALDAPHGNTPHIQNFFPRYYADHTEQSAKAQMAMEEAALAKRPIPLEDTGNYQGFHNKQRVFATRQEAQNAGFKFKYNNPIEDLKRYAIGAKLNIGNQAFIKAVREAQGAKNPEVPFEGGQRYSIDLAGDSGVKVDKAGAKALKNYGVQKPPGIIKKSLRGINTTIVKTIVANPLFHGGNQEFNAVFQGAFRMPGNKVKNVLNLIKNHATISEADRTNFYREGNFSPDYGKGKYGFIAKGIEKAGVNPAKAEISPRAMAKIEENIRVSLWKQGKARSLNPEQNTKIINQVLGGPDILGDMSSSVGLFLHYFTTNLKLLGNIGTEAIKGNVAPLAGLAIGTAAWGAAQKGWQEVTGNKQATVRAPGVLGVSTQVIKGVGQARRGQIPTVVTNHLNPLITTSIEEATNRNLRTPVFGPQGQTNNLNGKRVSTASSNLFGPGQTIQKAMGSSTSIPEALTGYATGFYTPHAKGFQAAPNIPILNTKNAQKGTGLAQQQQYFNAKDKLAAATNGDKRATDAVNSFLDRNKNSKGQSVQLNPEDKIGAYSSLASNPKALNAVRSFYRNSGPHPPLWDLSPSDLKTYLNYEATRATDPEKSVKADLNQGFNSGEGLTNFIQRNSAWYNTQPKHAGAGSVAAPGTPQYPKFSSSTQNNLNQYNKITDPKLKSQFIQSHPDVIDAFGALFNYKNALGAAQGGETLKASPQATPQLQKFINSYNTASKAQRKSIRSSNPQTYQNMIAFYDSLDLSNIGKQASKSQYQGEPDTSQTELKDIGSLASDIYQNAGGTYNIVPAGWMQGLKNSSSGSSGGSSSTSKTANGSLARGRAIKTGAIKVKKLKLPTGLKTAKYANATYKASSVPKLPKAPKGVKVKKVAFKTSKLPVSQIPTIKKKTALV